MIADYITHTVTLPGQTSDFAEEFSDGWRQGYQGWPTRDGASESWLGAHALGAKRRAEGWGAFEDR